MEEASSSAYMNWELNESFGVGGAVRQGWLLSIYVDGCVREIKSRGWDLGAKLIVL